MAMTAESLRGPLRFTIDLKSGLIQQPIRPQLMKGDKRANTIVVALTEDKKPVDLSGVTVTGSFISPIDDAEIPLTGSVNGNEASVTLVDECYAEEGYFEANIKLTAGETSRTILSITGHVLSKGSGAVIDAGDVIPSIDDIIAQYATMKQVTKDAQDAADSANAAAEHAPYINEETNHWMTWDASESAYADTGVSATGPRGDDGNTPYIGENGNWWIGGVDTGTKAQGPAGANGTGSGTVTGIQIGGETYEPDETGVVALPETGGGVPGGGTTGQMLFKISNEDGAAQWQTPTHDKVGALGSDPAEDESTETPDMQAVPINADQLGGMTYQQIIDMIYPIGRTITTLADEDNPNTLYPWQEWERTAQGRFIVGTGDPIANDDGTLPGGGNYALGSRGGSSTQRLTDPAQNAPHSHETQIYISSETGEYHYTPIAQLSQILISTTNSGEGAPFGIMNPYIAANIWRRTA